ncbi:plastocyanin/azurin family copper-binding protein [Haloarcula sp. JP-L23]|uniref:plastocyanin/azurin family copper-binding protein n=1 Tax=Haloarcula sp. JP-L23 TaxID=2716717 RepID=UPI00140F1204|nr:plastocyanin [Haloarcula sp. JP-L23]
MGRVHDSLQVTRRGLLRGITVAGGVGPASTAGSARTDETGTRRGTETPTGNATATEGPQTGGETTDSGGGTVTIAMTDDLVFDPDETTVEPGTTVVWENVGDVGHTVTAYGDDIPDEADFFASGGVSNEEAARSAYPDQGNVPGGATFEHTFDVPGEYGYFCIPHEGAGMVATLTVGTAGDGSGGSGPDGVPQVPESVRTLSIGATALALLVVGFAFFLLKYGGDYGDG